MENVKILREIIESIEKHSEFEVSEFNSESWTEENATRFSIKFALKQKEIAVSAEESVAPGTAEEVVQAIEPVEPEVIPCYEEKIPEEIQSECVIEPKIKKRKKGKICVDCINCYNDEKQDRFKCCKGLKEVINDYTSATFCDDYQEK